MAERPPAVLTEIRSVLDMPVVGRPSRAAVEELLTSGYAYALDLEGQCLRMQRRLREVVRSTEKSSAQARADEAHTLERLLGETDRELASVRDLLSTLRQTL